MKTKLFIFLLLFTANTLLYGVSITRLIDQSGLVSIGDTLIANPTDPNDAIITVSANNVILDLTNSLLTQTGMNQVGGLVGVRILPNVLRTTIRAGRIENITGKGIEIGDGTSGIIIRGTEIMNCDEGGILIEGIDPATTGTGIDSIEISDSIVVSCTGANGGDAIGISANYVQVMLLQNSIIAKNDAVLNASGSGCYINSCTGVSFRNNLISGNGGFQKGVGALFVNSTNVFVRESFFNGNLSRSPFPGAEACGVDVTNCTECEFYRCEFVKNVAVFGSSWGLRMYFGYNNIIFDNIVQNNIGAQICAGIELERENRSEIKNNSIFGNEGDLVYGIYLKNGQNTSCFIHHNDISSNVGGTTSFGIIDESDPSENCVIANKAFDHTISYSVVYPTGIVLPTLKGSLSNTSVGLQSNVGGLFDNIAILR